MARVIQISEAASLAIHSMVLIASADKQINVNKIAEMTGASRNHLAKVMQRLVKDGLVKSTRGPAGGFVLKRKPDKITLLDIYQSIEGAIDMTGCPLDRPICAFGKCLMGGVVKDLTKEFMRYFKSNTLASFI
jgi:Rrf2 family protein